MESDLKLKTKSDRHEKTIVVKESGDGRDYGKSRDSERGIVKESQRTR